MSGWSGLCCEETGGKGGGEGVDGRQRRMCIRERGWIGVGEQPSILTIVGSGIVLVCVGSYCIVGIRGERRRLNPKSPIKPTEGDF